MLSLRRVRYERPGDSVENYSGNGRRHNGGNREPKADDRRIYVEVLRDSAENACNHAGVPRAMKTFRELGHGCLESVWCRAFEPEQAVEWRQRMLPVALQRPGKKLPPDCR